MSEINDYGCYVKDVAGEESGEAYLRELHELAANDKILDDCEKILKAMTSLYTSLPLNIADPQPRRNLEESYKFMTRSYAQLCGPHRDQTYAKTDPSQAD